MYQSGPVRCWGGTNFEKMTEFMGENIPSRFKMFIKGLGFVLGKDDDFINLRVNAIGQGEIYEPVNTAEGNSGLGPVPGEGHEPLPPSTGHDKCQGIFHSDDPPSVRCGALSQKREIDWFISD
jgi:hypothetical protein